MLWNFLTAVIIFLSCFNVHREGCVWCAIHQMVNWACLDKIVLNHLKKANTEQNRCTIVSVNLNLSHIDENYLMSLIIRSWTSSRLNCLLFCQRQLKFTVISINRDLVAGRFSEPQSPLAPAHLRVRWAGADASRLGLGAGDPVFPSSAPRLSERSQTRQGDPPHPVFALLCRRAPRFIYPGDPSQLPAI